MSENLQQSGEMLSLFCLILISSSLVSGFSFCVSSGSVSSLPFVQCMSWFQVEITIKSRLQTSKIDFRLLSDANLKKPINPCQKTEWFDYS